MAKGNLFQGMARGKVGDVVFYRMNGQQMSRVRNRVPKNPRTNEQLYQRAVIATVMKAYSAGKEIFDHAFQGYTVGEGCMRRFNSLNSRILRSQLIDDINNMRVDEACKGRFVAPRSLSCTANIGFQISEGTLNQNLFEVVPATNENAVEFKLVNNNIEGQTRVNQYLNNMGIYAGDIFTFVFFVENSSEVVYKAPWTNNPYASQYNTRFIFNRLTVKSNIPDGLLLENVTYGDIFEAEKNADDYGINMSQKFTLGENVIYEGANYSKWITAGIIRSRLDVDLRSTSYLYALRGDVAGITSNFVLPIWQEEVEKVGVSELILEGGNGATAMPMIADMEEQVPVIPAPVNENAVPVPARHRGTQNNKR